MCILAGAGSGKTTTITRRIAHQVSSGTFDAAQVLAVTFTDKAAGEMRTRLAALGVEGVRARTFHSAALAQLRGLAAEPPGEILASKVLPLRRIANTLPKPYRFRPAADLASEVEWAKNRMIPPDEYRDRAGSRKPPIPSDLMERVYREYERGKQARGLIDFEDLLALAIRMFDEDEWALERFQTRYLAFTVDEYQDVNLLQQTLLDRWIAERDDICVVGDDYQSIYSFTGASPSYLLDMPRRYVRTAVIKLEDNYRSTPQILETANRLAPHLGGAEKSLRSTRPPGDEPQIQLFHNKDDEVNFVVRKVNELHTDGVPYESVAVLYRINSRSEDFEIEFARARLPYQVRGGGFLSRPAARRLLPRLARSQAVDVEAQVRTLATAQGYEEEIPDDLGDEETTRQNDLERLIELAAEFEDGARTGAEFAADIQTRFGTEGEGRGINLLTYHRAKGLEFDAVFLPRLIEGDMPYRRAETNDQIAEERRLFYVGITRARSHLVMSFTYRGQGPSRFLTELGWGRPQAIGSSRPSARPDSECFTALKAWRLERAKADGVPAYVVLHDRSLQEISEQMPDDMRGLAAVSGIGPEKLRRYGTEILTVVARFR